MFKKTALVAGIGLALSVTAQADYRWELGGNYTAGQTETNQADIDSSTGTLFGSWYMEDVDSSKGPLSEAAFLDHASDITLSGDYGEIDLGDVGLDDVNSQAYGVSGRYVAEGPGWKLSGWLVDLGYRHLEPNDNGDVEFDTYNIGIGNYITENTTLVLNYNAASINNSGDTDGYSADLEHMWLMSNGGGFKARASYGVVTVKEADDIDTYNLGGTWYFTNNFGIGADYFNVAGLNDAIPGSDGLEFEGWQVTSEWFITEAFAVNLAGGQLEYDNLETDSDFASIGAKLRF